MIRVMPLFNGLKRIGWGMRYAVNRSQSDYYASTTTSLRFSFLMLFFVGIAGICLYQMLDKTEIAIGIIVIGISTILILRSPDWIILPIIILNSTFFGPGSLPSMLARILTGGSNVFNTEDLLLFTAIILSIWEYLMLGKDKQPKISLAGAAIAILVFITLFGYARGMWLLNSDWRRIWYDMSGIIYLLLYFPLVILLNTPKRIKGFIIGLGVCLVFYILFNMKTYLFPQALSYDYIFGMTGVSERGAGESVRNPGILFAVMGALVCYATYMFTEGPKHRWLYLTLTILSLVAISVNKGRNAYIGALLGILIIWLAASWQAKWRSIIHTLIIVAIITPFFFAIPAVGKRFAQLWDETYLRFSQTFEREQFIKGGIKDRLIEIDMAKVAWLTDPILGYGYGRAFGERVGGSSYSTGIHISNYYKTHNSWMFHALKGGIIQVLALMVIILAAFLQPYLLMRKSKSGIVIGACWASIAFVLAMTLGSMVQGNFYLPPYTTCLVLGIAFPELIERYVRLKAEDEAKLLEEIAVSA